MEALQDSEDEDQDFVEVPEKEGYEPRIPDHLRAEYGELWAHRGRIGHPGSWEAGPHCGECLRVVVSPQGAQSAASLLQLAHQ